MYFPKIEEFMNRDVIKIDNCGQLSDALAVMNEHDIRDVIVCDKANHKIFLLTINDILRHYLIDGDLNHQCMGRSANARLARAISLSNEAKLKVTKIREIAVDVI